jgi:hypothetical protein
MAIERVQIECCACGYTWYVNLQQMDEVELVAYRDVKKTADYRVRCPNCDTYNIFTCEAPPSSKRAVTRGG